ncbi:TPA: bifunctional (p)ppGpp synthetase/guanosine-3',5'-bis(diphosphate) 3'-pyrophosphohydrolase [Bacillus cereus]|nr:bifunctional (p)ppGpp synthetase/guanosine-3',5'-bis(diphosphate) 3'-pyrophosphohydrolase [Bacillus cereus]HDR8335964.1 bifunctional (p)ppGpp synthetase/guanosine-3',5'-bis(diphosphate) 3'-pyrophosphohydrolase [Bacillus cereus]
MNIKEMIIMLLSKQALDKREILISKSKRIAFALEKATELHFGQVRKASKYSFMEHPIAVAYTLLIAGASEELIIAGILHDTVEDTSYTLKQLSADFGNSVAILVASNTEKKYNEDGRERSWDDRKLDTIIGMSTKTPEEIMLLIADKLDNIVSLQHIAKTVEFQGEKFNKYFKRGINDQIWYFVEISKRIKINTNTPDFFCVYLDEVEKFVAEYKNRI